MQIAEKASGRGNSNGGRMLLDVTVARQGIFIVNAALDGSYNMSM